MSEPCDARLTDIAGDKLAKAQPDVLARFGHQCSLTAGHDGDHIFRSENDSLNWNQTTGSFAIHHNR